MGPEAFERETVGYASKLPLAVAIVILRSERNAADSEGFD
jgi:hypothetical protein